MGLWVKDDGKSECLVVMTKIGLVIPTRNIQLERVQTSVRSLVVRELVEFLKRGKQMNIAQTMCAPINQQVEWHSIDWTKCYKMVRKLQVRIAKAFRKGKYGKAKALQWLLTHSFSAKVLAIRRVTENKGKNTAGVDGETWSTPKAKSEAITSLKRQGYKPKPLRRVYIPKQGGKRPLSIPCMIDRAMHALYLLGLEPISETTADGCSYGFRPERSTADAIGHCFTMLAKATSSEYVLEGDIRGCFNEISHQWILEHIPLDKEVLNKWLKAGFIDNGSLYPTKAGVPQGSPIAPAITNMVLDGLEKLLKQHFKVKRVKGVYINPKVHLARFADDFIVTGASKEVLEEEVKPLIEDFLKVRGLELSQEKTQVTHISKGFDFLGQNIRKYKGKLLIKPSKKNTKAFLDKVQKLIKLHRSSSQEDLIKALNPVIRGWANYHRHVVAEKAYESVDHKIWSMLWQWAKRRHPNKRVQWIKDRYFKTSSTENWAFAAETEQLNSNGERKLLYLVKASRTPIKRHIKIKGEAHPYDPKWENYFEDRLKCKMLAALRGHRKLLTLWKSQNGRCPVCKQAISKETSWHLHHILKKVNGGTDELSNLVLVHPNCHRQIHSQGLAVEKSAPL